MAKIRNTACVRSWALAIALLASLTLGPAGNARAAETAPAPAAAFAAPASAAAAATAPSSGVAAVAQFARTKSGVSAGICALPRAGDGQLALALAQAGGATATAVSPAAAAASPAGASAATPAPASPATPAAASPAPTAANAAPAAASNSPAPAVANAGASLVVHATFADPKALAATRDAADKAAILGRTLYAEAGTPAAIPFADDYVNLLLVADATDENLAAIASPAEILRALAPETGMAIVGLAKGASGKLSKEKLTAYLKDFTGAKSEVAEDATGLWATVRKPAKTGAVSWTHRLYSPANNPVSDDTACAWPLMTQWLGRPLLAPVPLVLVSQGRMATVRLLSWGNQSTLEMHDAHNGTLLWRRAQPDASVPTRTSGMVLLPDALYMAEGPAVLVFDPASGQEKSKVDCAALGEQVKWVVIQDGVLYAMAGSKEKPVMASQTWKIFGDEPSNFAKCGGMGAYDLASGKWLWTQKDPEELLDEGYIGLANGRLYYYVAGKGMACREAKTGKIVWENPKAAELVAQFPPKPDTRGSIGAIVCSDKAIVLHKATCGTIVMSAETGDPLWTTKAATIVLYKNLLLRKGGENWGNPSTFDLLTGTPSTALGKLDLGGGCGQFTITPNLLCGQIGLTYDFKASQSLSENGVGPLNHKTSCLTGSFVAEGQLLYDGVSCVCDYSVRGTIVQGAAVALPDPAGLAAPERLVRSDDADRAAPCIVDGSDWPTFRASNVRANASAAKVPAAVPAVRWTWTPATPAPDAQPDPIADAMKPNAETPQAVAVGNLVFASGADGSVTALDLVTGQVKWRFFTRARLYAPPTIAEGRCYIGSGDGIVYCLEATTGRQLWLYGAAPRDRRIMVYGDLVNTWPITGGVVVQDGVAYAAAGMFSVDNTTVVALDAKTGAPKWRNDVSGSVDAYRRTGVSAAGYPAVAQGKFWIRSSSYDLATGACAPFADPDPKKAENFNQSNAILNRYTGFFAGKYLMAGGRRFFDDPARSDARPGATNLEFVELAADGTAKLPLVKPWGACRIMPAWDDRQTLALPIATEHPRDKYTADLQCWDTPKMVESLGQLAQSGEAAKNVKVPIMLGKDPNKSKGEKFEGAQTWSVEKPHILAAVLGANAAVTSYISEVTPGKGDAKPTYTYAVAALDRATGTPMWEAPLPGEPLMDGLSLARDGSTLVRMLDGSLIALAGK